MDNKNEDLQEQEKIDDNIEKIEPNEENSQDKLETVDINKATEPTAKTNFWREWVFPFIVQFIVIVLIVKYVFFLTRVPTGSMLPTVQLDSWLFATKIYNVEKRVNRGDVVMFQSDELDMILLKRCVGLPGETVEIKKDGKIFINGAPYDEPYVVNTYAQTPQEFVIPEGNYLFLGDNRSGSVDARYWENPYTPAEKIIGEVHFTLYPFTNFGVIK
ncbi:MAG: signal peptidase I [Oscillospiraceae bacterium]